MGLTALSAIKLGLVASYFSWEPISSEDRTYRWLKGGKQGAKNQNPQRWKHNTVDPHLGFLIGARRKLLARRGRDVVRCGDLGGWFYLFWFC